MGMRAMPIPGMMADPEQQFVEQSLGDIGLQASFPDGVYGPDPQEAMSGLGGIGGMAPVQSPLDGNNDSFSLGADELAAMDAETAEDPGPPEPEPQQIIDYVIGWRNKLKTARKDKQLLWDECWRMYRGLEDWTDKDDWQSKIFIPKTWAAVEQASSTIKRLLTASPKPWQIEPINPDDLPSAIRADQMTDITRVFMDKARYVEAFLESLKVAFILGFGVIKVWWEEVPRNKIESDAQGNITRTTYLEGQLITRSVDPYNFFWLPGSTFEDLLGTIEETEIPKWKLIQLAKAGKFDLDQVKNLSTKKISQDQTKSYQRFGENYRYSDGPTTTTSMVTITEYYGPIIIDDEVVEEYGHAIIANDTEVLQYSAMTNWDQKPPYIAFSPVTFPLRPEGTGLVEMVRSINQAINKIANLSVDTLVFRLLPIFEVTPDVYENKEDLETGMFPGKILRRSDMFKGLPGLQTVEFADVSGGAVQVAGQLDRAQQEGSLVSEIQQALPRFRGVQTATEIEAKQANQESFFGAMAADIEARAIKPLVEKALDLILQFISTSNDPRIPAILGVGAQTLQSMTREQMFELVQGDYTVKVGGITEQLDKANTLQNLVQFMNLIGQNPQAWLPYINQDALLRRIVESFRPAIRDIDNIVADPSTAEARRVAMQTEDQLMPQMIGMIPQLLQQQNAQQQQQVDISMRLQEMELQKQEAAMQAALQQQQMAMQQQQMMMQQQQAQQKPQPQGDQS